jgi:hypothetical protein
MLRPYGFALLLQLQAKCAQPLQIMKLERRRKDDQANNGADH